MFICTSSKVRRSTKEKQKYMQAFLEIWSLLFVNFPFKEDMKVMCPFSRKRNLSNIHEGNVSFFSKMKLVQHYIDSLGAMHVGGRIMIIDTISALKLINKYFPK